ncbi:MAG: 8-oxo-dGTP diphosphatase [Alphaproteobacteria bacterium]|nr:8-oxo-dGTP diphosphatase [Alphaproteobacteria bacterium]
MTPAHPDRPWLAVSAAIMRHGQILLVKRARMPAADLFTLPGGRVEAGETLTEAVLREVREETALTIDPFALAGYREVITRGDARGVGRHFVVLAFAARWVSGEPVLNEELAEFRWVKAAEIAGLPTTEGLADIVASAFELLRKAD